jgi:PmbA protein
MSLADMLAQIDKGLLVDQGMGTWAGNVVAGEFSGNVQLGYKLERGELVGRVKDAMVAGNVYTALGGDVGHRGRHCGVGGWHVARAPLVAHVAGWGT